MTLRNGRNLDGIWGQTESSLDILFPGIPQGKPALRSGGAVFAGGGNGGSPSWLRASRQDGAEFAGGEALEGAEALGQFGGGQTALAVKPAKEVRGALLALRGVAVVTARD